MKTLFLSVALLAAAGCAGPPYGPEYSIGVVKEPLFDEAAAILTREGIRFRKGDSTGSVTGVRTHPDDAFRATRILVEWRRGKPIGSFLTREEFQMGLENN